MMTEADESEEVVLRSYLKLDELLEFERGVHLRAPNDSSRIHHRAGAAAPWVLDEPGKYRQPNSRGRRAVLVSVGARGVRQAGVPGRVWRPNF